jgi:hypothetical protein
MALVNLFGETADETIESIKEYINYDNELIKLKLIGLSSLAYRNQALVAA